MFGSKKRRTTEPVPLSESMLDLQGAFREQRDGYGLPLIELRCVWCGRGAGVDALDGPTPDGWYHYANPHRVEPPPVQTPRTVEQWQKERAEGSTNMDFEMWSFPISAFAVNYLGDGAMCPDCGAAAVDALRTAYMSRTGVVRDA